MGSWSLCLFSTLLCATGLFYSYGDVQTEEYRAKYLPFLTTMEESNEKQLVSQKPQNKTSLQLQMYTNVTALNVFF